MVRLSIASYGRNRAAQGIRIGTAELVLGHAKADVTQIYASVISIVPSTLHGTLVSNTKAKCHEIAVIHAGEQSPFVIGRQSQQLQP